MQKSVMHPLFGPGFGAAFFPDELIALGKRIRRILRLNPEVSNDWKTGIEKFQWLEKRHLHFPMIGKG